MNRPRSYMRMLPAAVILLAAGCASIGSPSGGPRDEDPPRFVKSSPAPGSVNFYGNRIVLDFDEIVNVKDAFTKVTVSPPSKSVPRVSSQGRHVTVQFTDTLLPNTTYTIDFANTIEDNNEGNALQGFSYSFSTGAELDTMRVSGMVLGAEDLEPQQGVLVGVYSAPADTALASRPFDYVTRTDDRGRFVIRGMKPGRYNIFSVKDVDNDWHRANPEEEMGFLTEVIVPSSQRIEVQDTVYDLRTSEIDTVMTRARTRFLPDDILLRSYVPAYRPQYLSKNERVDSTRLSMIFNAPQKEVPRLSVVGAPGMKDWYVAESSAGNDTVTYWLTSSSAVAADTLRVAMEWMKPDSLNRLMPATDTLRFVTWRPKINKKEKKENLTPADSIAAVLAATTMNISVGGSGSQEVNLPLPLNFPVPLASLDTAAFHLEEMIDSVWHPVKKPFTLTQASPTALRQFHVNYPWDYGTTYRLNIDTLAATGIYGKPTRPLLSEFKTKAEEEYCAIGFTLKGLSDSVSYFVELLNTSGNRLRSQPVEKGKVRFSFLQPGTYYARVYEDFNGNGLYDPGDYDSLRLPDMAYYYPKAVNIKKNWDKEEEWDVFATAIDLQKPVALLKNKPERKKGQRDTQSTDTGEDEEEYFDPTRNPFDPNDRGRRSVTGSRRP